MDVEGRRSFWNAIREDGSSGRAVLFATHYLEEADLYAERLVLISNGSIVADGTGSEIKALASGRTVRATLSRPDTGALGCAWLSEMPSASLATVFAVAGATTNQPIRGCGLTSPGSRGADRWRGPS
jgi:ABC-type multidrug transport system ATPase subunit